MITYGTNPGMVVPISGADSGASAGDPVFDEGAGLHGLRRPATRCWASRSTSSSSAAAPTGGSRTCGPRPACSRGARSPPACSCLIVPGLAAGQARRRGRGPRPRSSSTAGADWRESGCSMCLGMNGDTVGAGQYSVSTSNRNFEGRQGVGARTLLASPLTAAACAIARPDHRPARAMLLMEPITQNSRRRTVVHAVHQHRHRPDHPGALSDDDDASGPRQAAVRRLALRRRRRSRSPTSC